MFLFSTPPAREAAPPNPVVEAIRDGAAKTGTSFGYLLATAQRESALDPAARARTSSASGLFQFVEQTWLGLMKSDGPKLGLGDYAEAITARADGSFGVGSASARREILDLRENPQVAALMAGTLTQRNRDVLVAELGREPSQTDLYAAHFLGARGAVDLVRAAERSPRRAAALDFPDAAAANRSIFYDRKGRAKGAAEVYAALGASHVPAAAPVTSAAAITTAYASDHAVPRARSDGPALHSLFHTETRRGPVSQEVARLWRTSRPEGGVRTAALGGFFPRSTTDPVEPEGAETNPVEISAPAPVSAAPAALPAEAPLPPARPASIDALRDQRGRGSRSGPLDLSLFMKWRRA